MTFATIRKFTGWAWSLVTELKKIGCGNASWLCDCLNLTHKGILLKSLCLGPAQETQLHLLGMNGFVEMVSHTLIFDQPLFVSQPICASVDCAYNAGLCNLAVKNVWMFRGTPTRSPWGGWVDFRKEVFCEELKHWAREPQQARLGLWPWSRAACPCGQGELLDLWLW